MQIVKAEGKYRVYGEMIEVYDKLEPDFYQFMFDDNGPHLVRSSRPEIIGKVYGVEQEKINKCFNTYKDFNRSLGIMLVGNKGNGKTLFAKQMCLRMIDAGYPVINVTFYHPSLPAFMAQMSQECVFLFDEFEKMFEHDEQRGSAQNLMLSTFDGINMTKKMFIITCNDVSRLSEYIYNRPGRFHYSFTFTEPSYNDISEYLADNINQEKCVEKLDDITLFCYTNGLNYDCMRSIVFELNNGYSLIDTFDDLNIGYSDGKDGKCTLVFDNDEALQGTFGFEPFTEKVISCDVRTQKQWIDVATIRFKLKDLQYSDDLDLYILPDNVQIDWDNTASIKRDERKEAIMYFRNKKPLYLKINISKNGKVNPLREEWNIYDTEPRIYADEVDCEIEVEPHENISYSKTPGIGFKSSNLNSESLKKRSW